MKLFIFSLTCVTIALISVSCDKGGVVSEIKETKSKFSRIVFTDPGGTTSITLVSENECEINGRRGIVLSEYSRDQDKLRIITKTGGESLVAYYDISENGITNTSSGEVLLLPGPLQKFREAEQKRNQELAEQARVDARNEAVRKATETAREKDSRIPTKELTKFFQTSEGNGIDSTHRYQLVITDVNIKYVHASGKEREKWLGELSSVKSFEYHGEPMAGIGYAEFRFKTAKERDDFTRAADEAIRAWRNKYLGLPGAVEQYRGITRGS